MEATAVWPRHGLQRAFAPLMGSPQWPVSGFATMAIHGLCHGLSLLPRTPGSLHGHAPCSLLPLPSFA